MFTKLWTNTRRYLELSREEFDFFCSLLEVKTFRKKQFLLKQGDYCYFEAYIVSGLVISYHTDAIKHKIVLSFLNEDHWMTDYPGLAAGTPSKLSFQALENTKALCISKADKELLYQKYPVFERLFRLMYMLNIGSLQMRTISLLSKTAAQRYVEFTQLSPGMEQRVPQYLIASYIGISPEFMSKIRRRMNRI